MRFHCASCLVVLRICAPQRQACSQGGLRPPCKNFRPLEKCFGHSVKYLGPSQKTLRPPWCPKLVMGLLRGNTTHERKDELAFSVKWFGCRTFKHGVALVHVTYCTIQIKCSSVQKNCRS